MRWGSASPNPAPDGCGELFLGWAGACQVLGGDMSCWQLAHGHHHPVGIQEITTLLTLRISPSQQHPEYHDPINIQDCLRAPRRSTPRCLLPPHPRHCHPMPGQDPRTLLVPAHPTMASRSWAGAKATPQLRSHSLSLQLPSSGHWLFPTAPTLEVRGKGLGHGLDPTSDRTWTQTYPPRR